MGDNFGYYTEAALKNYGWSPAMIKDFGLVPTWRLRNPHYPRAGKMKLYPKSQVHAIEQTKEFKDRIALKRQRAEKISEGIANAGRYDHAEWVDDPEDDSPWAHLCRFVRDNSSEGSGQSESSSGA